MAANQGLQQANPFSRPIPGMGLAMSKMGTMPWQKPPRFVHLDEALEHVWEQLTQPQNVGQVLALLSSKKLTCQDLADVTLFQGFTQGLWTMTLGLLMFKPVLQMYVAIAHKAGIKYEALTKKADPLTVLMQDLKIEEQMGAGMLMPQAQPDENQDQGQEQPQAPEALGAPTPQQTPSTGLMGMPPQSQPTQMPFNVIQGGQ